VVVPPHAAERVPERKSSAKREPSLVGWSKWQWPSTPPGVTSRPRASISRAALASSPCAMAQMRPSRTPMSAV